MTSLAPEITPAPVTAPDARPLTVSVFVLALNTGAVALTSAPSVRVAPVGAERDTFLITSEKCTCFPGMPAAIPAATGAVDAPPSPPPHEEKLHAIGGTQAASTWSEFGVLKVAVVSLSFSPFRPVVSVTEPLRVPR